MCGKRWAMQIEGQSHSSYFGSKAKEDENDSKISKDSASVTV
jgi:hypothetical protein